MSSSALEGKRVIHVLRSAGTGGVESHVKLLVPMQQRAGALPAIVSLARTSPHVEFQALGCPLYILSDRQARGINTFLVVYELFQLLRELAPDIVHLHGARPIFVGALAARAAGVRAVLTALHGAHNLMAVRTDGTTTSAGEWIARLTHGVGFRLSARTVVCAAALLGDVERCLATASIGRKVRGVERTRVIYHGIEARRFLNSGDARITMRRGRDNKDDVFTIGTLTRLDEPKKGVGVLLDAVSMLESRGLSVALRIAGTGHSRHALETRSAELGLCRCEFLGYVEHAANFYQELDLFVLPSFSEGLPLVNLEAMASGLAVVTTDVGGASEAVVHGVTGLVVPPGDAMQLASAIENLARDQETCRNFGAAGRARVLDKFSVDSMFEELTQVYVETMSSVSKSGAQS
jgi:glycosyltransferase involved in cell wall biosynthesis